VLSLPIEEILEGLGEILDEMEPVRDLHGAGRPLCDAIRIRFGPITDHDLDPRVVS
jgi:hypothetical protein